MENTSSLYDTLVQVLNQHANGLDFRHLKTLAWMMVGLIHSSSISLCAWTPFVVSPLSRPKYRAPLSTLAANDKSRRKALWPAHATGLVGWFGKRLSVALDTSMLWNTY